MLNISTITGSELMTNCYVIEEDNNAIIIDFVPEVIEHIKRNKLKLQYVMLTHIHFDHIIGLSDYQKNNDFKIIVSENGKKNINNPEKNLLAFIPQEIRTSVNEIDITKVESIENGKVFKWNEHNIKAFDSPGHTDDSMMFIFDEINTVFTGDTIFNGSVGRTDFPNGDHLALIKSVKKLFDVIEDDYILYPGHGPKTTVLNEKKHNPFLRDIDN